MHGKHDYLSGGSSSQGGGSEQQLRATCAKQQAEIIAHTQKIESLRKQLKKLSTSASKIIDKKLKNPYGSKSRPNFHPKFETKKLEQLNEQKNKIYRQISDTKNLIFDLKNQEEPEVKFEILKKEAKLQELTKNLAKHQEEKKFLKEQLTLNKDKILDLKKNANNVDYDENEKAMERLKKEKVAIEKSINTISAEEVQQNLYYFELKQKVEKRRLVNNNSQGESTVSQEQIRKLIKEINEVIESRNNIENEKAQQIGTLKAKIAELEKKKKKIQQQIRDVQGDMMKKDMEERFYQSRLERQANEKHSKSTSHFNSTKQYSSLYNNNNNTGKKSDPIQETLSATKNQNIPAQNTLSISRTNVNEIHLGNCEVSENCKLMTDSAFDAQAVEKVTRITFLLSEEKIVGLKTHYQDGDGKKRIGELMSIDRLEKFTEKDVTFSEFKEIQYPKNSKNISFKMIKYNGESANIGIEYYGATVKSSLSLKNIKSLDVILEKDKENCYQKLRGIIIHLVRKGAAMQDKSISQGDETFLTSPERVRSTDNIHDYKKKLVLKPLKKSAENLDHRLLIRKKLV